VLRILAPAWREFRLYLSEILLKRALAVMPESPERVEFAEFLVKYYNRRLGIL